MQNLGELKRINPDAMEELRQNPEKYLGQMDFDIVNNHNPDVSILYDNQIIDVVIDKATQDIMALCDQQNAQADFLLPSKEGFIIRNDNESPKQANSPLFAGGRSIMDFSGSASKKEEPIIARWLSYKFLYRH